ncbi:DUF6573 family protein [Frondihabitans sucicola]|nr:DUF6573 family protein [Frondihabitans sucicola]
MPNTTVTTPGFWDDAEVIHAYTAADAVADGDLVALDDKLVKSHRILVPVLMTRAAYADAVDWTRGDDEGQSITGRAHDVLSIITFMGIAKRAADTNEKVPFELHRIPDKTPSGQPSRSTTALRTRLQINIEGYDMTGMPCFIISMPGED